MIIVNDWKFWTCAAGALLFWFFIVRAVIIIGRNLKELDAGVAAIASMFKKRIEDVEEEQHRQVGNMARLVREHDERCARIERQLAEQTERQSRRK